MSLRRRLMQNLEGLNDEAIAFFLQQSDLLLTMPEHCRHDRWRLLQGGDRAALLDRIEKRPAIVSLVVRRGAQR